MHIMIIIYQIFFYLLLFTHEMDFFLHEFMKIKLRSGFNYSYDKKMYSMLLLLMNYINKSNMFYI